MNINLSVNSNVTKTLRLALYTTICGVSLSYLSADSISIQFRKKFFSAQQRAISLDILQPLKALKLLRFNKAEPTKLVSSIVDNVAPSREIKKRRVWASTQNRKKIVVSGQPRISELLAQKKNPAKIIPAAEDQREIVENKKPYYIDKDTLVSSRLALSEMMELVEFIAFEKIEKPQRLYSPALIVAKVENNTKTKILNAKTPAIIHKIEKLQPLSSKLKNTPRIITSTLPAKEKSSLSITSDYSADYSDLEDLDRPFNPSPAVVRDRVNQVVAALEKHEETIDTVGIREAEPSEQDKDVNRLGFQTKDEYPQEQGTSVATLSEVDEAQVRAPVAAPPIVVSDQPVLVDSHRKNFVTIIGKLATDTRAYPGHFEVGFYKAISPTGIPIGAPSPQAILMATQTNFTMNIPRNAVGYLFARYVGLKMMSDTSTEWHRYPQILNFNEINANEVSLTIPIDHAMSASGVVGENISTEIEISGKVGAMFASSGTVLPLAGVKVKIRGTKTEAITANNGDFTLKLPQMFGRVLLEITKAGYLPRIIEQVVDRNSTKYSSGVIELASREAVRHVAQSLGLNYSANSSVLIVEAKSKSKDIGLPGISAQLSLKSDGPYYFSEKGYPQSGLRSTTTDGRMIFFNVEVGVGFLEPFISGENVTPVVVPSLAAGDLIYQPLEFFEGDNKIEGKLLDAISGGNGIPSAISGARIRVAGSPEWTETDSFGAFELPNFRFVKNAEILIEVSKSGYYNHRFSYKLPGNRNAFKTLDLYAFPQLYIQKLARSLDIKLNPNLGLLMGTVAAKERLRMDVLLDHSAENEAKDFYFDSSNFIQGNHAYTDPQFGTYMIFDVQAGRSLLHGYNPTGVLNYSDISYFSPSTVTVLVSE